MTPTRRRTTRPPKRGVSLQSRRKKAKKKVRIDLKNSLIKFLIGLVLIVDLALVFFIVRQCSEPTGVVEEEKAQEEPVILQVEVMNGCGVPGIANTFTDFLRENGIDVVRTGNYEEEEFGRPNFNVDRTVIIDRRGKLKNSVRIAQVMGLNEDRVIQQVNQAYLIDATIVLGRDFRQLNSWKMLEKYNG